MNEQQLPAADVYEVVVQRQKGPKNWLRVAAAFGWGLFTMGSGYSNPGGSMVVVKRKDNGAELCRYSETFADDNGDLITPMRADLEAMTVAEFVSAWGEQ